MTSPSPGTPLDDDALSALLDRPFTELTVDELMALKAGFEARGARIYNSVPWEAVVPLVAAAGIYSKTFLETLAQHNADALIKAVATRFRSDRKTIAYLTRPDGDEIFKFIVVGDLPDAASVALRDADVIAEALRGKILRWDKETMAWRPVDSEE